MSVLPRLTPYEWYNPHPCIKGRCNLLINQYSLGNSFWFPVGGFMQQGSAIAPRALSTRCVSGVWLVFIVIFLPFHLYSVPSCLNSSLAAFLPLSDLKLPASVFHLHESSSSCIIFHPTRALPSAHAHTLTHPLKKPRSVFSSEVCGYFNPPTSHPDSLSLRSLLIYIGSCLRVHMSPGFPPQVGFHLNHHFILHCQPGCLPHGTEDGGAHRVGGRPGRPDGHRVRHHARRIHHDLLPGQNSHATLHVCGCKKNNIQPPGGPECPWASAPLSMLSPLVTFLCFLTFSNRQFYLFPACSSPQSSSILPLQEMRHLERHTLSSLITSRLDLRAPQVECERNRVEYERRDSEAWWAGT